MALTTASSNLAFLPIEQSTNLIIRPVQKESVAMMVSTVVLTSAASYRVPIIAADPSAGFVAEGADITPSDATLAEFNCVFKKLAGLSIVSNELLADATPETSAMLGAGLARDMAKKLDAAWTASSTTSGPAGLGSLTTSTVDNGGSWTDADPFIEAIYTAEAQGAVLTSFVANPADALELAQLKEATGSNKNLLQPDVTLPGRRAIAGVPLITSPAVTAGEVWGIPQDRVMVVVRTDVDVQVDGSVYFNSDRSAIRAVMRCAFAWPQPLAIIKIYNATP